MSRCQCLLRTLSADRLFPFLASHLVLIQAWLSQRLSEHQRRVGLAAYVMSIQMASFVGSNLFTAADAPRYRKALLICAGCVLAAAVLCSVWKLLYRCVDARQLRSQTKVTTEGAKESLPSEP